MTTSLSALTTAIAGIGFLLAAGAAYADDPARDGDAGEAEVTVSDSQEKFIYLDDGTDGEAAGLPGLFIESTAPSHRAAAADKGPVFVIDSAPLGYESDPISIDAFALAPQQTSRIRVGYPLTGESEQAKKFGVWLSSEVAGGTSPVSEHVYSLESLEPAQRSYNVGVNVGYGRFAFGAALLRNENRLNPSYQGYDFGFGYFGDSWFTNVHFAGYRNEAGPLYFSLDQDRKLQAFEVGAGYALWPWLTFSGQFKYFDYSSQIFPELTADQEHIFSLDTKLNF